MLTHRDFPPIRSSCGTDSTTLRSSTAVIVLIPRSYRVSRVHTATALCAVALATMVAGCGSSSPPPPTGASTTGSSGGATGNFDPQLAPKQKHGERRVAQEHRTAGTSGRRRGAGWHHLVHGDVHARDDDVHAREDDDDTRADADEGCDNHEAEGHNENYHGDQAHTAQDRDPLRDEEGFAGRAIWRVHAF